MGKRGGSSAGDRTEDHQRADNKKADHRKEDYKADYKEAEYKKADNKKADFKKEWLRSRDRLIRALLSLGYPEALGIAIVRNLGSPKAMDRMTAYLVNVKPKTAELVVDEMLAIQSEIDAWRKRKRAQEANAVYNEVLYYGLGEETEEEL